MNTTEATPPIACRGFRATLRSGYAAGIADEVDAAPAPERVEVVQRVLPTAPGPPALPRCSRGGGDIRDMEEAQVVGHPILVYATQAPTASPGRFVAS